MRDDHAKFEALGVRVVVVVKDSAEAVRRYWTREKLPMIGLPDPSGELTQTYGQQWKLQRLGRMPAQFVIDCRGAIPFADYGRSMSDIPTNAAMLPLLAAARTTCGRR
jgi:peroxiredoxin